MIVVMCFALASCSERRMEMTKEIEPESKDSSGWRADQVSLTGEWHPSVRFQAVEKAVLDYLTRIEFTNASTKKLVLYLDEIAGQEVVAPHRSAYEAVLDQITTNVQAACKQSGVLVVRGSGRGTLIDPSPLAEKRLRVSVIVDWNGSTAITIFNHVKEPFSFVKYEAAFRAAPRFVSDEPIPKNQ